MTYAKKANSAKMVRRRLARDQVESIPGRSKEVSSVFDVQPDARVFQRMAIGRVDRVAHGHDVARQLDDVD